MSSSVRGEVRLVRSNTRDRRNQRSSSNARRQKIGTSHPTLARWLADEPPNNLRADQLGGNTVDGRERNQDMNANACVLVRRRCVGIAVMAFALSAGCTPRATWVNSANTIQPGATQAGKAPTARGFLLVETNSLYPSTGVVYDQSGFYLQPLPNNTSNPLALVALPPGEYIVLVGATPDPPGGFHQLQVRIEDGQITRVSKADISQAPTI